MKFVKIIDRLTAIIVEGIPKDYRPAPRVQEPTTNEVPTQRGKRLAIRRRSCSNRVLELNESCWSCISFTYLVCRVRNLVGPREPILRDHHTLADHIAVVILFAVALNSMCPEPMSVKVPCNLSHILTSISTTPTDQFPHPWKSLRPSLLLSPLGAAGCPSYVGDGALAEGSEASPGISASGIFRACQRAL